MEINRGCTLPEVLDRSLILHTRDCSVEGNLRDVYGVLVTQTSTWRIQEVGVGVGSDTEEKQEIELRTVVIGAINECDL